MMSELEALAHQARRHRVSLTATAYRLALGRCAPPQILEYHRRRYAEAVSAYVTERMK